MAQDDIQGVVTDENGDPVQDAVVALFPNGGTEETVVYTTTDSNGEYLFDSHPYGDGTTQQWHLAARYDDGSGNFNSLSLPYVSADLPSSAIPDSAIHHYPTDEGSGTTLTDNVAAADGTINGATWDDNEGGRGGWVLAYDGVDDNTDLSDAANQQLDAFTMSTWLKIRTDGGGNTPYMLGEFDQDEAAILNLTGTNAIRFLVQVGGSNTNIEANVSTDTWHYVVGSFDVNDNLRLYIDGTKESTGGHSFSRGPDFGGLAKKIGERGGGTSQFDGFVDDTIIADEQWTDATVSDYYNDTSGNYS